ncbi:MAG: hypothetical protein ACTSXL_04680 [Alphaproteobacteria bacterium]|nr:MAG: hypothetical protein B6I23_00500 [Rickettsiaceae bacterium 4572_127]
MLEYKKFEEIKSPNFYNNLKKSGKPSLISLNETSKIVVMDPNTYSKIAKDLELLDTLKNIKEGLEDLKNGDVSPLDEAFTELAKKHKFKNAKL